MTAYTLARGLVQAVLSSWGYQLERKYDFGQYRLDVLELLVERMDPRRADFFFIQVGANDGEANDQINRMVRRYNWRGILLEPQPAVFEQLVANYAAQKGLVFLNAALGFADGEEDFWTVPSQHGLGSFDRQLIRNEGFRESEIQHLRVKTVTAQTILRESKVTNVDLLQVDTEGFDFEIIKMFFSARVFPSLINFEHLHLSNSARKECIKRLGSLGYKMLQAGPQRIDTIAYRAD